MCITVSRSLVITLIYTGEVTQNVKNIIVKLVFRKY